MNNSDIITPIWSIQTIQKQFKQYELLKQSLLSTNDFITIRWVKRIKKSWFRKLATAFGISIDIVHQERVNYDWYHVWNITAKAIAPNGRFATCCASCASNERDYQKVENDVRTTAQTRASNRAIADLIGAWEVSAEETTSSPSKEPVVISPTNDNEPLPITDGQKKFLSALLKKKYQWEELEQYLEDMEHLSKWEAHKKIKDLAHLWD